MIPGFQYASVSVHSGGKVLFAAFALDLDVEQYTGTLTVEQWHVRQHVDAELSWSSPCSGTPRAWSGPGPPPCPAGRPVSWERKNAPEDLSTGNRPVLGLNSAFSPILIHLQILAIALF